MGANESHSGDSAGDTVSPPAFVESTISNVDLQLHDICASGRVGSFVCFDVSPFGLVAAGTTTGCVVLFGPHGQQRWLRTLDEEHAIVALHFVHHSLIAIAADSTLRVWSLDKIHGGTTYTDVFDVLAACTFTMTLSPNDDEEFPDRTITCSHSPSHNRRFLYLGTASGAVLVFDTLHFRLSNHSLPAVPAKPQEHPTNQNNVKSHFHIPDFSLGVEAFYDSVSSLCSVSDDTLIVGYSSGTVHAFNMSTRKPKQVWHVVDFTVTALCSTPEGCVAGFADGTIAVLNLNSNRPVFSGKFAVEHESATGIAHLHHDSRGIFVAGGHSVSFEPAGIRLIRPASDFLSNIELVGCALSSLWSAAPSSALLSTAPGILGSLSEPAKASAEPHLVHTASMVDLFHDAACVRTFLIQSDHSVAWLTDNNEIWIQARPGEAPSLLAHDHLLTSLTCSRMLAPSDRTSSELKHVMSDIRNASNLHASRSNLVAQRKWPVSIASSLVPERILQHLNQPRPTSPTAQSNTNVIANPSALFNTTVDMSQHERASLLVTGHAGQVCLWDISNPFALDLLHCILLPKSDIKVTALHVEVSTGLISIAVGCDSGDTYVYQSHLSKLDSSAEAVEDSEEIGPFRRVFSMPMHVSPIQSIAYWPSVHRLAVGDRDGVFSLSDSVSGEALSYEILNASHTDMEDLIITSLGVLHLQHKLAVMVGLSSGRLLGYDLQSGQALFDYVPHVVKKGAPKMDQSIRLCCLIDSHNGRVISLSELSALSSQHINPSPSPVVSDQPAADPGAPEPLVAQPGECVPPVSNGAASSIGQGLLLVAAGQTISLHTLVSPAPMHKEKPVAPFRLVHSITVSVEIASAFVVTVPNHESGPCSIVVVVCKDRGIHAYRLFDLVDISAEQDLSIYEEAEIELCQFGDDGRAVFPSTMGITMRASLFASVAEPLPLLSIDALALKSPSSEPKPQRSFMQSIFGSSEPNVLEALNVPMPADVQHGNGRLWTSPHAYPSKIKSPPVESQPLGSGNGDNSTAEILARARAQTQDMKDRRQEKEQQQQLSTGASGIVGSFSASDAALRERLNRRALGLDRDQDAQSAGSSSSGQNAHGGVAAASSAMSDNVDAMKRNVRAAQEIGVKSAEMADNARNFAQMAKQMRQQQSSWW